MHKSELIVAMAEKSGMNKKDIEKALNSFVEVVTETLANGEPVQLLGFGAFEVVDKPERTGRNPATGEEMTIAACKVAKFKSGKALKEAINK